MNSITLICFYIGLSLAPLCADALETRDEFDDLINVVDLADDAALISSSTFVTQSTKANTIFNLSELGALALLQQNVYLRTNNLKTRSLLDYPQFLMWRHDQDKRAVYVDLFYNQTSRLFFTNKSSNICSYLAVSQPTFINTVQTIITNAQALADGIDTDKFLRLLELAQTFTVQERRLGLMIGGKTRFDRWHFNIMAPWYYLERNHFVNQDIQNTIEALVIDIQADFGITPPTECEKIVAAQKAQKEFQDQHLISDKFGIGDTRIYLDYPVLKRKVWKLRLGFLATLPTAFAMVKGLRGSHIHRIINPPLLNLQQAVAAAFDNRQLDPEVQAFGIAALDNLSALLLDTPMGNGGHFGFGVIARNRTNLSTFMPFDWARNIIARSFISAEYQFPAQELRSFRIPVNPALFNARNLTQFVENPNQTPFTQNVINSNYAFIVQQLTDRLFPAALYVTVNPGIIFRWSSQMTYETTWGGISIGTDTYVRNKEHISHINADNATLAIIDTLNARYPVAYQSKTFGSIFFKVDKPDKLWTISLYGDYTFMNQGIGSDSLISLNVDVAF